MAKVENKEAKLDNTMANIYDEKTKEMSLDSTDFIKMNQSHSALSRDNDTDKKIDTQIADSYKKKNKLLIAIIVILVLTILALSYGGYTLYSKYDKLAKENKALQSEVDNLKKQLKEQEKEEEPIVYNQVFVGESLLKNYNLSNSFKDYNVVNSSRDDLTTKELLNNLNSMVYAYNPSKVFINVGLNDLANKEEIDTIISNIKEIVLNIKEKDSNIEIYVLSLVPLNTEDVESVKSLNKELNELSNVKSYVDLYGLLKDKEDDKISILYSNNNKELNEKGYETITDKLLNYLEK